MMKPVRNSLGLLACAMSVFVTGCDKPSPSDERAETQVSRPAAANRLWQADLGNGHYQNPILYADYSDPDVVAVGDDFYMTASSFNASPGLPILHSTDLVNWELTGYAVDKNSPAELFAKPQHGNGIWAPNIRYHDDKLWIFFPDPDHGIYMTNTSDPKRGWSEPKLILPGKGIIDPTPLWDDDGQAYLLHGWAKSRSGKNNILTLHKMSADGTEVEVEGEVVINGHELEGYRTLEGPKFYKRGEYYYVFAPAGGVPVGWQSVFRSKNIYGPYEDRIVMEQGDSITNGPHQGAWVHTPAGEDWFIHFQARGPYGRIVHLQPMQWKDGWPVIGVDEDGDGVGNPVTSYRKPEVSKPSPVKTLPFVDEFSGDELALQWQWNANYDKNWYSLEERKGYLRLFAQQSVDPEGDNLWMQPSLLLQKLPAPEFIVQTTFDIPETLGEADGGLLMFGEDYAWIGFRNLPGTGEVEIGEVSCRDARKDCTEHFEPHARVKAGELTLRMTVSHGGQTVFSYQMENGRFRALAELFQARRGRWVGAKVGLFVRTDDAAQVNAENYIDVKDFRFIQPAG